MMKKTVCVTGGSSYIGSLLVNQLLTQGFTVHATLRTLKDESKVGILRSLPGATTAERLKLFEADIYKAEQFESAIQGCDFVFHLATPLLHTPGHKHTNRVDATLDAARSIAAACIRSKTVKRLIYTASVMAASPLKDDDGIGLGFKDVMDETCWTSSQIIDSLPHANDFLLEYTKAKTLTEKELLSFGNDNGELEVVTLACGLVGGKTLLPQLSGSLTVFLAPLTNNEFALNSLKFLQELLGKIPIVHIEDVVKAHMWCLEEASMNGRFLCANGYVSTADIARYYRDKYPEFGVKKEHLESEGGENGTKWGSRDLLGERGFEYQYGWQKVLDDSVTCARQHHLLGDV